MMTSHFSVCQSESVRDDDELRIDLIMTVQNFLLSFRDVEFGKLAGFENVVEESQPLLFS